jgi:hypothetical protein
MSEGSRDGQRRLATIAAVFWFEMVGALLIGSMVVLSPLSCFGDPGPGYEGPGPCPGGAPALFREGSLALWALVLGGTAAVAIFAWLGSRHHPITRAVLFALLGLIAATPVVAVAVAGGVFAVLPFLWVGVPAFLLLASWVPVLASWRP